MLPIYQEMHKDITQSHENAIVYLKHVKQSMREVSIDDCADLAFTLREVIDNAKDIAKQTQVVFDELEKFLCSQLTRRLMETGEAPEVGTEFCLAQADSKTVYVLPKYNESNEAETQQYYAMMRWLGIDENLWDRGNMLFAEGEIDTKVVDVHYHGIQGYLQRLSASGYDLSECKSFIDTSRAYQRFTLRIRKRKGVQGDKPPVKKQPT